MSSPARWCLHVISWFRKCYWECSDSHGHLQLPTSCICNGVPLLFNPPVRLACWALMCHYLSVCVRNQELIHWRIMEPLVHQMSHQTSANSHQTPVRQVPHIHQTFTIRPPDIYGTICTPDVLHIPDIHQTSFRYMIYVWCKWGTCLTDVWWEPADVWCGIWQSSDREHQTNSNCPAQMVEYVTWLRNIRISA